MMRKTLMFLLIFTGTVFMVFVFNIMMYALVPEYHDAISSAIATSEDNIPVVTPDMVKESAEAAEKNTAEVISTAPIDAAVIPIAAKNSMVEDGDVALSASATESKEPIVIDKEYHEDCGTGKGYWVITYSDGSTGIE